MEIELSVKTVSTIVAGVLSAVVSTWVAVDSSLTAKETETAQKVSTELWQYVLEQRAQELEAQKLEAQKVECPPNGR